MNKVNIYSLLIGIVVFTLGFIFLRNSISETKVFIDYVFPLNPLIIQFIAFGLMALGIFFFLKSLLGNRMNIDKKNMSKEELYDYKENQDPLTNLNRNLEKIIIFGGIISFLLIPRINEYLNNGRISIIFWLIGIAPIVAGFMKIVTRKGLDVLPYWLKDKPAILDGLIDIFRGIVTIIILAILKLIP